MSGYDQHKPDPFVGGTFEIKDNEHGPDTQAGKESALSGSLASGSSTQGMSGNVNPDNASLESGFEIVGGDINGMTVQREGDELTPPPLQQPAGVCGRPGGWER